MKRMYLVIVAVALLAASCQKETINSKTNVSDPSRIEQNNELTAADRNLQEEDEVVYSGYFVNAPDDDTKLITIEEYERIMNSGDPQDIGGRGKDWVKCFYETRDGEWKKGKTCATTTTQGCTEAAGCRGGTYLP